MRFKASIVVAVLALASVGFAQGQGGGGRGQGRGFGMQMGGGRLTNMLRNPQVQTELKITDEQKTKIEALPRGGRGPGGAGAGGQGNGGGGGGQRSFTPPTPEEQLKQLEEDKKAVADILTAEQTKRLHELRVQWAGPRAAMLPDVQADLKITPEQKAKIDDLNKKMNEANQALMEKARNGEIDRQDIMPAFQKNNETLGTEVEKILTADQKTKLKEMGGKELKQEPMRRPGGGGGRRNG